MEHQVFFTQQPNGVPTLPPALNTSKKPSSIPISSSIYHTRGSPSVAVSVYLITLQGIEPTKFPSDVQIENPSDKPTIHTLQAPTGLPCLVPYIQSSELPTHVPSVY